MEKFIDILIPILTNGGGAAVIVILLVVVAMLIYDRIRMIKELAKSMQLTLDAKEAEKAVILEIVEKYHQGNLTMVQAINEIKLVLAAIQSRIQ
jgi:hypothetical protein